MHGLRKNGVTLNRKVLSNLAIAHPNVFEAIVKKVK
jgi:large subunit ribosomal protein L20